MFKTEQQADQLLDGPFGRKLLERFESNGTIGRVSWDNLFRNVTNSRHAINKVEDLRGLKIRVQQSPVYTAVFKELGTNPAPMSFSELFTALETRTMDAQETPFPLIYSNRFYEVQKYLAVTRHAYRALVVKSSKKVWDGMSPAEHAGLVCCGVHRPLRQPLRHAPHPGTIGAAGYFACRRCSSSTVG